MKLPLSALAVGLAVSSAAAGEPTAMLVLMHGTGKIERYEASTGKHVGTLLSGLPPANTLLPDPDGRLLISTGNPGAMGTVLRFDPRSRKVETLIDVPDGYGGRLFRATGMAWLGKDLLVASQGDGKVKRYAYPSGEWLVDAASASPGGITQIAVREGRLFVTDFTARMIGRASEKLDGSKVEPFFKTLDQSPWGLTFDDRGQAFASTSAARILRFDGKTTVEWAGAGGGLSTPMGLCVGPDGRIHAANWTGRVTTWKRDAVSPGAPERTLDGPEVKAPIAICFVDWPVTPEYVYKPLVDVAESPEKLAYFEERVRPILVERCVGCHGATKQEGGLRLDTRDGWVEGGDSGSPIRPGRPEESLLIQAVRHEHRDVRMPPKKKLEADRIETLTEWIRQGAVDPRSEVESAAAIVSSEWEVEFRKRLDWWSLKPVRPMPAPATIDRAWSRDPYDRFILARLEAVGLKPAPPSDPEVLLRRLSFVLTGLPPTVDARTSFLDAWRIDPERAYERLVDSYLASPRFGERFARHWMDVVRYTDTYGYEWDNPAKGSHEYRDYLVRAFNADIGFDTLVREQLAGDLLPKPRLNQALGINESMIGPMFHHMGEHRHGSSIQFNGIHQEMTNNKIDAFSKAFLAYTAACARCHDHKLDPIAQRDYFALGAIFMIPRWTTRVADAPGKNAEAIARLKELREEIRDELAARWRKTEIDPAALLDPKGKDADSIDAPAHPIARLFDPKGDVTSAWETLTRERRSARESRLKANAAFRPLGNLAEGKLPEGWVAEGEGIEHGIVGVAAPLIALEGDRVVARFLSAGIHTHALSSKLPGALRSPPQDKVPGKITSVNVAGAEFGGYIVVDQNAFQGESVTFLASDEPTWKSFADTPLKNGVHAVTVEFATSSLNPNFPPRTGLAKGLADNDLGYEKRSRLSLTGIVTQDAPGAPADLHDHRAELERPPFPKTAAESTARLKSWLTDVVARWADRKSLPGEERLLNLMLEKKVLPATAEKGSRLADLVGEYRRVEGRIRFPRVVNGMDERSVARSGVEFNVRGNVDVSAGLVPPDYPSMFEGRSDVPRSKGSGRLELAEALLRDDHPLTSRVYVNRVWRWVFGEGLVATPDDFGRLGESPSHPELLDRLASDFLADGWSTKRLVRRLVLSATFRQSGTVTAAARSLDPSNRLLHHYATRRLEAEEIRDALLAVSGRLDDRLGGRPINPHRTGVDGAKRLFSGPLDGDGRRSIYLTMSIMAPPAFLKAFDLPDLKLPSGRRNATNVPTQSLLLMNDPFVVKLAEVWAESLVANADPTAEARVRTMFVRAYAREPKPNETATWSAAVREFAGSADVMKDKAAWTRAAHAVFNTAEFLYRR